MTTYEHVSGHHAAQPLVLGERAHTSLTALLLAVVFMWLAVVILGSPLTGPVDPQPIPSPLAQATPRPPAP